jgi:dihydropteroate synthase
MIWKFRGRSLDLSATRLMGILNITPDSFSDGGKFFDKAKAVGHARSLIAQGADILDLGAESTRPGAIAISADEELERIVPVLTEIRALSDVPISIDTTKPAVAMRCLELGADIVNDVSGLKDSGPQMAEIVRSFDAGLVLMHRRGNPGTMQSLAHYSDVIEEILKELEESIRIAVTAGIERDRLAVDPGIGFAKTAEQSFEIIRKIKRLHILGLPIVLGHSRKSFIAEVTGQAVCDREWGTAAVSAVAALEGIQILRVHHIAGTKEVISITDKIKGEQHVRT